MALLMSVITGFDCTKEGTGGKKLKEIKTIQLWILKTCSLTVFNTFVLFNV